PCYFPPLFESRYTLVVVSYLPSPTSIYPLSLHDALPISLVTYHQYPPGKAVTVYYDPQHPDRSVLEPGINEWLGAQLVGGLVLIDLTRTRLDSSHQLTTYSSFRSENTIKETERCAPGGAR